LPLFNEPDNEPKAKPQKPKPAAAEESAFARSAMLAAAAPAAPLRKQTVQAVELLLSRGGVASEDAFAVGMGVSKYRVGGLVSRLQEVLNVDGYQVLRHDTTAHQVYLDREKLNQQFEVKL
jgi:hypothetical protein